MYDKILVPLDGSKLAECVLPHVKALASGCSVKEIILLRACEPVSVLADYPGGMPATWEEHLAQIASHEHKQCRLYLDDVEKQLKDAGIAVRVEASLGNAAKEIVESAARNAVDLIIMASHGRTGPSRWAYGSTTDKVLRSTCVPILLVRGPGCMLPEAKR